MKKLSPLFVSLLASIAVIFLFGATVHAELSLNGELRVDTRYETTSQDSSTDKTIQNQKGHFKLIPSIRTETGNLYMESKAQLLVKQDGTVAIEDAYGKIGTSKFDVQLGRFQGYKLFNKSNDMYISAAPGGPGRYEAAYARGRFDSAGQLALHAYPSDALGMELGLVYGQDGEDLGQTGDEDAVNVFGVRPVISSKLGPAEFAVGAEMLNYTPQDSDGEGDISKVGYGAKARAVFGIATLGINYASGTVSKTYYDTVVTDDGDSQAVAEDQPDETTNTLGAYCDLAIGEGVLSLAAFLTDWETDDSSDYDKTHNQYFIAYAHPLPIEGAVIKMAVSQASATDDDPSVGDSDAMGFKVRVQYNF
jgi:hypothetical protein